MPKERLWESPFTDISDRGVDGVFPEPEVRAVLATLDDVRRRAVA
jgi:type I restriction enzyme, R subunit